MDIAVTRQIVVISLKGPLQGRQQSGQVFALTDVLQCLRPAIVLILEAGTGGIFPGADPRLGAGDKGMVGQCAAIAGSVAVHIDIDAHRHRFTGGKAPAQRDIQIGIPVKVTGRSRTKCETCLFPYKLDPDPGIGEGGAQRQEVDEHRIRHRETVL